MLSNSPEPYVIYRENNMFWIEHSNDWQESNAFQTKPRETLESARFCFLDKARAEELLKADMYSVQVILKQYWRHSNVY